MCAFCTMMAGGTHWTEAGTDAGRAAEPESGRTRYLGRLHRVTLINRILDHYGCAASDWANNQYVVKSHAGRTALVAHLPQMMGSGRGDRRAALSTPWTRLLLDTLRRVTPGEKAPRVARALDEPIRSRGETPRASQVQLPATRDRYASQKLQN